jgi:hypothetical protein
MIYKLTFVFVITVLALYTIAAAAEAGPRG